MDTPVHQKYSDNAGARTLATSVRSNRVRVASRAIPLLTLSLLLALTGCKKKHPTGSTGTVEDPHSTTVPVSNTGFVEARTSQIVTNGQAPAQVFDDFVTTKTVTIRTLSWQGIYCVQQVGSSAPAPTASSFTVAFYTDVSGRPNTGAPVQRTTYPLAQVGQTFEKNVSGLLCGTAANTQWPFFRYSVTLATPFVATAGTKYWVSVQATTPSYAVYWGWRDGTVDNRLSLQLFQGAYTTYNVDRAYALIQ